MHLYLYFLKIKALRKANSLKELEIILYTYQKAKIQLCQQKSLQAVTEALCKDREQCLLS